MPSLREILEWDGWPDALDMGFAPPDVDFQTAEELEAERREETVDVRWRR